VLVIVDQLAAWMMAERRAALPASGGFARLAREGLYFEELRYQHATTSTAPGHAALLTGLPPRGSGVYANERVDPTGKPISIFADPQSRLVGDAVPDAASASASLLRAPTLADALRAQRPDAHIVAVSLKDRGAILGGGQQSDASLWFDAERRAFVTASAFAAHLPPWASEFNSKLPDFLTRTWLPTDEPWLRAHALTADDQVGEGDVGLGIHFPYDLSKASQPARVFRSTPLADEAVLELALRAIEDSDPQRTELIVLSFSALDYVGHTFGPDSWESWDLLLRLDRSLARLMSALDRTRGGAFALLLSADHGTVSMPELGASARPYCGKPDRYQRPCSAGGRLAREVAHEVLRKAANQALGDGEWILGVVEPFGYFTEAARGLDEERRRKLETACITALAALPEVARTIVTRSVPASCPPPADESLDALVCRSLAPGAGELYIVTKPGSFFDATTVPGHGINHGSPYVYDRTVPVFVRSAEQARAGQIVSSAVSPADFVRTAAALLEIDAPPGGISGRDLRR
jgi:hypothetical protein